MLSKNYFVVSLFAQQGVQFVELSSQILIPVGKFRFAGSIVTHEYDAVYGGTTYHEIIVMMTVWGMPTDETDQYVYTFNNIPKVSVPSTMKKASGAAVTSFRSSGYDLSDNTFVTLPKTTAAGPAVPYKRK